MAGLEKAQKGPLAAVGEDPIMSFGVGTKVKVNIEKSHLCFCNTKRPPTASASGLARLKVAFDLAAKREQSVPASGCRMSLSPAWSTTAIEVSEP